MNHMNTFLKSIWKSIYGPEFYASHYERSLGNAWGYFTMLSAGVALLTTVALSLFLVPKLNDFLSTAPGHILEAYPDELVLTFENGVARSNVPEPYFIPYPASWNLEAQGNEQLPKYLAIIETSKSVSEATIFAPEAKSALLRLYQDGIIMVDNSGGYRLERFTEMTRNPTPTGTFVLSETQLASFLGEARKYFGYVPPVVVSMIFVALLFFYGCVFVWVAFVALFIMLLGKLLKKDWTYPVSLKLGLYSATLPLILYSALPSVAEFLGVMGFAAMMLGVLVVNFGFDTKSTAAPAVSTASPTPEDPNKGE